MRYVMLLGLVLAIATAGCANGPLSLRGPGDAEEPGKVTLPNRLLFGWQVLREAHLQTGLQYAYPSDALVRQIDASQFDGATDVAEVVATLAPVVRFDGNVLLLESDLTEEQLEAYKETLRSGEIDARRLAAYELGSSKSTAAIRPLLEAALGDENESVRHHALRSLDRLERDFRKFSPAGRISIFEIEDYRLDRALSALIGAAEPTSHEAVWAMELVGRGGRWRRGRPTAIRRAARHGYAGTRETAEWTLGRLRRDRPEQPSLRDRRDPASIARIQQQLETKEGRALVEVVRLAKHNEMVGPEVLLDLYDEQDDEGVRGELLLALGRKGGEEVWNLLMSEMDDESPVVRLAAVQALRRCPDPDAVDELVERLTGDGHPGPERTAAAQALGLIASDAVVRQLSDYVEKADNIIDTAAMALGWTDREDAVPALIACTQSDNPDVLSFAFNGLARIGTAEAVDAIARRHNHRNNVTRYVGHAAIRLAGAQNQSAVDRFVEVVSGGGVIAGHGLEMAEDPRAVDVLIDQIPQSDGRRLFFMVQTLGRIGDPKGVPTLIELLDHESDLIKHDAMRALRWRWHWHREDVQTALAEHPIFKELVEPVPSLEDQEPNTWVLRSWPIDFDDMRVCNTSYEAGQVFDESTGKVVKWGSHGQRCDSPQLSETWLYDAETNEWTESNSPVSPFGMCGTWGLTYDRANRCVISVQAHGAHHGWQWIWGRASRTSVPWVYFGEQDRWVPVRSPMPNPGPRGFCPLVYHDRAQVALLFRGQWGWGNPNAVWVYDAYTNTWTERPAASPRPGGTSNPGWVYLPEQDRVLRTGGSWGDPTNQTWLYDIEENTWTDLEAEGDPPVFRQPVNYDPATGTVVAWQIRTGDEPATWQYDPEANRWARLATPQGMNPRYFSVDMAYDNRHNVYVLNGGLLNWWTDHIAIRETWTYKLPPGDPPAQPELAEPENVEVQVRDGEAVLTWDAVRRADGYNVYSGVGENPWNVEFSRVGTLETDRTFRQDAPAEGEIAFYYVTAVRGDEESSRSLTVRTQPRFPLTATASVRPDRTVEVEWDESASPDVVGYNVYAATVRVGGAHNSNAFRDYESVEKLNEQPVQGTRFHDDRELGGPTSFVSHEVRDYLIRAVNANGVESGPSVARTLPGSVPRVKATVQPDGSTLVTWEDVPEKHIQGYAVYRMDEFRHTMPIRITPHPVQGTSFVDWCESRDAERRRYYVVAINALGERGEPSIGAWAFGRP